MTGQSGILSPDDALDRSIDPVSTPAEYQEMITGLIGDQDPAEVQSKLADQLAALIEEAGPDLRKRPDPGEWSVLLCMAHIVDAEIVSAARYRLILAHDRPPITAYDQDLWVDRLHDDEEDPQDLLALFRVLRAANLKMWAGTSPEQRSRVGLHEERGPESLELCFKLIAGHGLYHLAQARRALRAVRASG